MSVDDKKTPHQSVRSSKASTDKTPLVPETDETENTNPFLDPPNTFDEEVEAFSTPPHSERSSIQSGKRSHMKHEHTSR